jgi:hypothetical protein
MVTSNGTSASVTFTVNGSTSTSATLTFNIPMNCGVSLVTSDSGTTTTVLHAQADSSKLAAPATYTGNSGLTGVAIFGLRTNFGLISETGVPASPNLSGGRVYIETHGAVSTGLALSNTGSQDAQISFYFTDQNGHDFGSGSFLLPADNQIAAFSNQAPFNGPADFQGTLTFVSSVPVSAIALRGLTNERGEFLMSTLPVAELGVSQNSAILPQFADGGGWVTQVVLVNSLEVAETGTVQFYGQGDSGQAGPLLNMTVNGITGSTVNYAIPPHGALRLVTSGTSAGLQVGSVQISPAISGLFSAPPVPSAFATLSLRNNGVTVSEASIAAYPMSSSFHVYLESAGTFGNAGSIDSGVAIANPSVTPATVSLQLTNLDGTSLGFPATINVPAGGQIARFITELFPGLPPTFQGIGKLTTTSNIALAALRGRYNERREFLMTTTPPANDMVSGASTIMFPHIVSGLGFGTQIVLFGQPGGGKIVLLDQSGTIKTGPFLVPGP